MQKQSKLAQSLGILPAPKQSSKSTDFRTYANTQVDSLTKTPLESNKIDDSIVYVNTSNDQSTDFRTSVFTEIEFYTKKPASRGTKRTLATSDFLNDRIDDFTLEYNRRFRGVEDFRKMDFQQFAVIAIEEYLKNRGF